jgi:hypothetical protein
MDYINISEPLFQLPEWNKYGAGRGRPAPYLFGFYPDV